MPDVRTCPSVATSEESGLPIEGGEALDYRSWSPGPNTTHRRTAGTIGGQCAVVSKLPLVVVGRTTNFVVHTVRRGRPQQGRPWRGREPHICK